MRSAAAPQLPLSAYGLVADGHTAALIGADGGVGWLCLPRFDSPAALAPLLDANGVGGACTLAPPGGGQGRQSYLPQSNVLVTDFEADGLHLRLTDWMPPRYDTGGAPGFSDGALCRRIECVAGAGEALFRCAPRYNYGRDTAEWERAGSGWRTPAGATSLWVLGSTRPTAAHGELRARVPLAAGANAWFLLAWGQHPPTANAAMMEESLRHTTRYWQGWAAQAQYDGPYREAVVRSALALKAMVYAPTGAIVAAPTASLPEAIGGPRNWDYRYCWPRDATFALYGLSLLGYHDEAGRFLEFVAGLAGAHPLPMQVCYRVDGSADLAEHDLTHLGGYRGSRPVRIGNGAVEQRQLDIYGEVLDAAYTYAKWRNGLDPPLWKALLALVDYAAAHWNEPDESIWEVRGGRQPFVYSKVMCWVALDRGVKMARRYHLPGPVERWSATRDQIHRTVLARGYNRGLHSFTQTFDNTVLDSSALLLPLVRFLSPHDARMQATIRRVQQRLSRNSLVARYENTEADGVGGPEGAFSICTFWMIDCLTLLGRAPESRALFERMLAHASPLGLYSEELDPASGALLGNFPQAFTHMALLNSAHNLELYPAGVPEAPTSAQAETPAPTAG